MSQRPRRWGLAANFLLLAGALLVTGLFLSVVELGLRLAGIGGPDASRTSRLEYQQLYLPTLVRAHRPDGVAVLETRDPRLPYQSILAEKPPGALRIFVFGGSATAGLGYSPNVTFARHLERMLERAIPGREIEVVNLGIVALASQQVKLLVAEACSRYDPDLVVVYSGNNEFLEIHGEKWAEANSGLVTRVRERLMDAHLSRVVYRALRGPPKPPSLADQDLSRDALRRTQEEIIADVEVSPDEIAGVIDDYTANIDEMARVALETETPILLMGVASNWEWRGREDLPADWVSELVGPDTAPPEAWRQALSILDQKLAGPAVGERSEWLFERAVAAEALGRFEQARDDYRAAMNEDPHLRRALDLQAERVGRVARARGVDFLDTIELLSASARHGIVGFGEFYDYVHLTPRGAVLVAAGIFERLQEMGVVDDLDAFEPQDYVREQEARLRSLEEDPLDVGEWMGFGFDPARIGDRDLWKYDRLLNELDRRIEEGPEFLALAYRGNARFFSVDGASGAASDYRAALSLEPDRSEVRANLQRLMVERRP